MGEFAGKPIDFLSQFGDIGNLGQRHRQRRKRDGDHDRMIADGHGGFAVSVSDLMNFSLDGPLSRIALHQGDKCGPGPTEQAIFGSQMRG